MKIKYEDQIDIEDVEDIYAFEAVARLVDNEKILTAIKNLRELLGIKTPVSYFSATKWLKDSDNLKQQILLNLRISSLKEKFDFDYSFDSVIKLAVLAGKVTSEEYKATAYCIEFPPEDIDLVTDYVPRIAIIVSPDTKVDEIKEILQTKVATMFHDSNIKKRSSQRTTQKRTTVREVRRWYWLSKKMKYPDICALLDSENEVGDEFISQGTIESAVRRYKKKIHNLQ
jgi:hypothetical protein